jgi:hypothetical protein
MMLQLRRNTLTKRERVACRCRRCPARAKVTPGSKLVGIVSSANPPTVSRHRVATATASPRQAARCGTIICVRGHCQPARWVSLKPCLIQARNPYHPAWLEAGGKSVRPSRPQAPLDQHRGLGIGSTLATGCESRASIRSLGSGKTSSSSLGHWGFWKSPARLKESGPVMAFMLTI